MLVRGAVHLAPRAAAADADGPGLRVDVDVLHGREVDDDAVVDGAEAGSVVATAAHREGQVAVAGERDHLRYVVRSGTAGDQGRPLVDHRVVDLAGVLVAGVLRPNQLAGESAAELAPRSLRGGGDCAHPVSFGVLGDGAPSHPRTAPSVRWVSVAQASN